MQPLYCPLTDREFVYALLCFSASCSCPRLLALLHLFVCLVLHVLRIHLIFIQGFTVFEWRAVQSNGV